MLSRLWQLYLKVERVLAIPYCIFGIIFGSAGLVFIVSTSIYDEVTEKNTIKLNGAIVCCSVDTEESERAPDQVKLVCYGQIDRSACLDLANSSSKKIIIHITMTDENGEDERKISLTPEKTRRVYLGSRTAKLRLRVEKIKNEG